MNHPVPLKPDDLSAHLTCAICLNVPTEPVLPSCQHMFCRHCLDENQAVRGRYCPTCRAQYTAIAPLEKGSFGYRIWSEVGMKCGNFDRGCKWTGSIVDAKKHMENECKHGDETRKLLGEIDRLKRDLVESNAKIARLEGEKTSLNSAFQQSNAAWVSANQEVERQAAVLRDQHDQNDILPKLFHGAYNFNRFTAGDLSQLIARFYLSKPPHIDSNRIYNCISDCYKSLERNYNDNPGYFRSDMHMLLATCVTCTWFSNQQQNRFSQWMTEQGWGS